MEQEGNLEIAELNYCAIVEYLNASGRITTQLLSPASAERNSKMVNLNIAITGRLNKETAEWLFKFLMLLADFLEFDVKGGFAEAEEGSHE